MINIIRTALLMCVMDLHKFEKHDGWGLIKNK